MLMQNFKSAVDLGISEPQKEALMKTLVLLETGGIEHFPAEQTVRDVQSGRRRYSGKFNMTVWAATDEYDCGTVCCIGGTAELVGDVKFGVGFGRQLHNTGLHDLFYPRVTQDLWPKITPEQAATALRSYLTTGEAHWDLAVSRT